MRNWPIFITLGVFLVTTAVLLILCLAKNGGQFVYTLDDPYIHMAIAKNVVQHGVWGVTQYQFSSSSSSPLWTLILALFDGVFGVHLLTSFVLNLVFDVLALWLMYIFLRDRLPGWIIFLALIAEIFFTSMAPLAFTGMEHSAHLFFTLLTVGLAAKILSEDNPSSGLQWGLLASAFVTTAFRYEGLFLVLVLGILFTCRKRWLFALLLVIAGALPIVGYGIWSVLRGWYFLPNSVFVKGVDGNRALLNFLQDVFVRGRPLTWQAVKALRPALVISRINATPHLLFLMIPSLLILVSRRGSFWKPVNVTNAAFIGSALLHMQFAGTGWFYRYEAYVVFFGIYAVAIGLADHLPRREEWRGWRNWLFRAAATILLAILVSSPLRVRAAKALRDTPTASHNIFEQQYQMATFLRQFYQGQVVAANDIGAIDYMAEFRVVDLAGLGTRESASYLLKKMFGPSQISAVADQYGTQIALVYDSWFQIPYEWIKIGTWQIPDNVVCGSDTVSFYAVNPAAAPALTENMHTFAAHLPADVVQQGIYR